ERARKAIGGTTTDRFDRGSTACGSPYLCAAGCGSAPRSLTVPRRSAIFFIFVSSSRGTLILNRCDGSAGMRVLIVEDERTIAAYIRRALVEQGYAVDMAHTGTEALDWADAAPFDVIVLDI